MFNSYSYKGSYFSWFKLITLFIPKPFKARFHDRKASYFNSKYLFLFETQHYDQLIRISELTMHVKPFTIH